MFKKLKYKKDINVNITWQIELGIKAFLFVIDTVNYIR